MTVGCTRKKFQWSFFLWGLGVAATNAYAFYQKSWKHSRHNKQRGDTEKETLTYQDFLENLANGIVWPEESSHKYSSRSSLSLSFNSSGASVSRNNFKQATIKFLANKGHINKRLGSYEALGILSRWVAKISELSMKKVFPHRLDGKFHPYITPKPWIPCPYCQRNWHLLGPAPGKLCLVPI